MNPLLLIAGAYVLGSIPFGVVLARAHGVDLRQVGSGNIGATNVARALGRKWAIAVLIGDAAKGFAPVWLGRRLHVPDAQVALAGLAAIVGHMFTVFLRGRGGKGVATATGAFLAMAPLSVAGGILVFLIVILATRFVSLASMLSAASIPLFLHYLARAPFWSVVLAIFIAIAIIAKHHSNIARLTQGTERRMGAPREER